MERVVPMVKNEFVRFEENRKKNEHFKQNCKVPMTSLMVSETVTYKKYTTERMFT